MPSPPKGEGAPLAPLKSHTLSAWPARKGGSPGVCGPRCPGFTCRSRPSLRALLGGPSSRPPLPLPFARECSLPRSTDCASGADPSRHRGPGPQWVRASLCCGAGRLPEVAGVEGAPLARPSLTPCLLLRRPLPPHQPGKRTWRGSGDGARTRCSCQLPDTRGGASGVPGPLQEGHPLPCGPAYLPGLYLACAGRGGTVTHPAAQCRPRALGGTGREQRALSRPEERRATALEEETGTGFTQRAPQRLYQPHRLRRAAQDPRRTGGEAGGGSPDLARDWRGGPACPPASRPCIHSFLNGRRPLTSPKTRRS